MSDPYVTIAGSGVKLDKETILGTGADFIVYAATYNERPAAAKTYRDGTSGRPKSLDDRLQKEYHTLRKVAHPNIVRAYGTWRAPDGRLYLIMERLDIFEGAYTDEDAVTTLEENIRTCQLKHGGKGARSWDHATRVIVAQICQALEHAHRHRVTHNDLKPDNIFVKKHHDELVVKLFDFSAAGPKSISGRCEYAAPERLDGEFPTEASDVYSLGILLCCLLTGTVPYPEENQVDARQARNIPVNRPDDFDDRSNWPSAWKYLEKEAPEVAEVLPKILSQKPEARLDSIAKVVTALKLEDIYTGGVRPIYGIAALVALLILAVLVLPLNDSRWYHHILERQSIAACNKDLRQTIEIFCQQSDAPDCPKIVSTLSRHGMCSSRIREIERCVSVEGGP